jgi:hypothetical protein
MKKNIQKEHLKTILTEDELKEWKEIRNITKATYLKNKNITDTDIINISDYLKNNISL